MDDKMNDIAKELAEIDRVRKDFKKSYKDLERLFSLFGRAVYYDQSEANDYKEKIRVHLLWMLEMRKAT